MTKKEAITMTKETRRTWAEIHLDRLARNYEKLRSLAPNSKFGGLVKANAYGHGAVPVAKKLEELGADYLLVACLDEAEELREAGIKAPILILGYTPVEDAPLLSAYRLTQALVSREYADALAEAATAPIDCCYAVDTGNEDSGSAILRYEDGSHLSYSQAFFLRNLRSCGRGALICGSEGSVTIIGAVSPQGSDFSEPVTQNTKRFTRCFWALDKSLAYARHYPAINWMNSYSEYFTDLDPWFRDNLGEDFIKYRNRINAILHEESSLMEIVKLIGSDVLPDEQKLVIEVAKAIRVGFLQQNAFHADDTFVPLEKQKLMMKAILYLYGRAKKIIAMAIPISSIMSLGLFERLAKMKYDIPNSRPEMFDELISDIDKALSTLSA